MKKPKILTIKEYKDEMCQEAYERGFKKGIKEIQAVSWKNGLEKGKEEMKKKIFQEINKWLTKNRANNGRVLSIKNTLNGEFLEELNQAISNLK